MPLRNIWLILFSAFLMASCGRREGDSVSAGKVEDYNIALYKPLYAKGFEVLGAEGHKSAIIVTKSPWQGSKDSTMLFISRGEPAPADFKGQVVEHNPSSLVVMASSHIGMLRAIGQDKTIKGVSGSGFVYDDDVRSRSVDVGYDGNIDYENLILAHPDLVLLYGVDCASGMEGKLQELGIPYMYVGEYLEEDPLGKSEWMVALAEIFDKRDSVANEVFAKIPEKYNSLKAKVIEANQESTTVMVNTPYADAWVMPSNQSYVARLIHDAGGRMAYDKDTGNRSEAIDMEQAYLLASQATVWLNVGQFETMDQLRSAYPKFADTPAMANGQVWNCTLRQSPGKGNDYWESGVAHPELVLEDLVRILHPALLPEGQFTYYQALK